MEHHMTNEDNPCDGAASAQQNAGDVLGCGGVEV